VGTLASTTADLWVVDLNGGGLSAVEATTLLSPDERARADAFRHEAARRRYLFAHAALRRILADRLEVAPLGLSFATGPQGKPELAGAFAGRLHFNLTHSADLALAAVSTAADVGVDVEKLRPSPNALALAERFFTPAESVALAALPAAEQPEAFLQFWTRKEALAKATGQGILTALTRFELACDANAPLRAIDGDPALAQQWTLHTFTPAPGYLAAAAIPRPAARFTLHHFCSLP
jgi:4'-phosphopantetheinyl transferase